VSAALALPPMQADMDRQPAVLKALLQRREDFLAAGRAIAPGPGGRVYVAGCGDGVFAAEAASLFAERCGLDWRAIGALDLILSAGRLSPRDRVICISGNVDRTVEAAEAAAKAGAPLLALVNGDGGRLGRIAATKISLDLADLAPFLCGTASYIATVGALMLLADGAAGANSAELDGAPSILATALGAGRAVASRLAAARPSGIRILAAGPEMGTARYGAAKFVELTRLPAWAADLEEFAHSQYWSMPTSDLVAVIATNPIVAGYAVESCRALGALGVATLAIDTVETPVETAEHRVTLPAVAAPVAPLASCLPLQQLAYAMAEAGGLDPNTRLHLKNDAERFRVSRILTRRSLLGTGQ
jgi:glucosamine 6-phosphate synthetase-like amidotransferase/phosphosugar isomerase protein